MDTDGIRQLGLILLFIGVAILACFAAFLIHTYLTAAMFYIVALVGAILSVIVGSVLLYKTWDR